MHVVVDSVDLHYLREARRVFHAVPGRGARQSLLDDEYGSQMAGELNVYVAADAVLTVSQKEASLITDVTGGAALAHAVHDCEDFPRSEVPFAQRRGVLVVGSYQYLPNVEAVEYLCREVLPRMQPALLEEHPVYVIGQGLGDKLRELGREHPCVRMVGWVPSVTPYFERCRISVVPLLYGAGTKRKMLQALMAGTPTVATRVGAEGLDLHPGTHFLQADDPEAMADAVTRLLVDEDLWSSIAADGCSHVAATHGLNVVPSGSRR